LSVVHHQLSAGRAADPKVYLAYTRFMESLSREMPLVHDYVVSRWIENRRASRRARKATGDPEAGVGDEDGPAPSQLEPTAPTSARAASSFPRVIPVGGGSGEGPDDAGEPDEDGDEVEGHQVRERGGKPEAAESDQQESEADDGDDQEASADQGEDEQAAEPPVDNDENDDELVEQDEASEAEAAEADPEPTEGEPETEEPASEVESSDDADELPESEASESDSEAAGEEGAGDKDETDGGEWPTEDEAESSEDADEMEGEGDEPSPDD
jgi:hypothetical protein